MKLAVDAGHYINTPGKRTPDDIREWTLNSRVTEAFLSEIRNYDITIIRTDDPTGKTDVTLNQRDAKAKAADVFLSIHHNAFAGKWGDHGGTETLIQSGKEHSRAYATAMNNSVVNTLGLRNRGIKAGNTQVLRNFNTGPSCLVEVGFMDSNTDRIIRDPEASVRVGKNLATAFAQFFSLRKLSEPSKPSEPKPVAPVSGVTIMGKSQASAQDLTNYVLKENAGFNHQIAEEFISVGNLYGIKGDIAFAQSILETGWFKFAGSSVRPEQNNFCGLGATGGGNPGNSFTSIREGVTAQIQHLLAYASKDDLPSGETLVDPRFKYVTRGIAPTWTSLNGRWATGANYGEKILAIYDGMDKSGSQPSVPSQPKPTPKPNITAAEIAKQIFHGTGGWGNQPVRQQKVEAAGVSYDAVVVEVAKLMGKPTPKPTPKITPAEIAKEIFHGKGGWGNQPVRQQKVEAAGVSYQAVVNEVAKLMGGSKPSTPSKPKITVEQIADEIIKGKGGWGNNPGRADKIRKAGLNPADVQSVINRILKK